MDAALRVVTRLPLQELWKNDGLTAFLRCRSLSAGDITAMLRVGRVQFVVADVGAALIWVSVGECFDFWKNEVSNHLAAPDEEPALNDFPNKYFYFASEWTADGSVPIVLLERHH